VIVNIHMVTYMLASCQEIIALRSIWRNLLFLANLRTNPIKPNKDLVSAVTDISVL
jgi:hypothetical protein